jgi:hypothetical protein
MGLIGLDMGLISAGRESISPRMERKRYYDASEKIAKGNEIRTGFYQE